MIEIGDRIYGSKTSFRRDILRLLHEIEVLIHGGMDIVGACRKAGVSDKTYYVWRKKFGSMGRSQLNEMKSLQKENDWLKKIVLS